MNCISKRIYIDNDVPCEHQQKHVWATMPKWKGKEKMKELRLNLLMVGAIGLLMIIALPLQAKSPPKMDGEIQYIPHILDVREDGCTTTLTTYEDAVWTGIFEGNSRDEVKIFIHCSGRWSFGALVSFDEVTVDGKSGSLVMFLSGSRPNRESDWLGDWVIVDGTGELEHLRGSGTFWGPGAPGPEEEGDIEYAGHIHFKPDKNK